MSPKPKKVRKESISRIINRYLYSCVFCNCGSSSIAQDAARLAAYASRRPRKEAR